MQNDELVSLGYIGLERASRSYDKTKGSFSSYARLWMRSFIKEEIKYHKKHTVVSVSFEDADLDLIYDSNAESPEDSYCFSSLLKIIEQFRDQLEGDKTKVFLIMLGQYSPTQSKYSRQYVMSELNLSYNQVNWNIEWLKREFKRMLQENG
jgi:RNA polymerase sigma factor (sigma-70 family)